VPFFYFNRFFSKQIAHCTVLKFKKEKHIISSGFLTVQDCLLCLKHKALRIIQGKHDAWFYFPPNWKGLNLFGAPLALVLASHFHIRLLISSEVMFVKCFKKVLPYIAGVRTRDVPRTCSSRCAS
jgi:hypothetical protein